MKVFSHRGFHRDVPENTLAAFKAAIALGVDGIETDLRVTQDGELILFHHPHTPEGLEIANLTREEISQSVGYEVPRLEEAIALTRYLEPHFCWNLELKVRDCNALMTSTLESLKLNTKILITSFWHDVIVAMMQAQQSIEYGLIWASHPYRFDAPQWFEAYDCITTLVFYQERLSAQLIDQCHQKSKRCFAYGDRTSAERLKLAHWSIDGLITDYPQCAQQTLQVDLNNNG